MTRIRAAILSVSLCLMALAIPAAEPPIQTSPAPSIEKIPGGPAKVTFQGQTGRRYQVYFSADLKDWEFHGSLIPGTDRPITVEYADAAQRAAFFKVESRPVIVPISAQMGLGPNGEIILSFPTVVSRRYLAYFSTDLKRWDNFVDLLDGTGRREPIEIDPGDVKEAFFRVEAVDILPLPGMVWIRPGQFVMGSPKEEKDRDQDEDPLTQVLFQSGFWMGKHEVTQRQYERIMGVNPSTFKGDLSRPVEQVSWDDTEAFCKRLTQSEFVAGRLPIGYVYRLPTEAEFEYACRSGTTTRFYYGDDLDYSQLADYAWYSENSQTTTHPVGLKKPNLWGLYDINGNVWEWCLDWYQDRHPGGSVEKPAGPPTGTARVFRGGGWDYNAASCRSAYRNNVNPARRAAYLGFRLVLGPALQ